MKTESTPAFGISGAGREVFFGSLTAGLRQPAVKVHDKVRRISLAEKYLGDGQVWQQLGVTFSPAELREVLLGKGYTLEWDDLPVEVGESDVIHDYWDRNSVALIECTRSLAYYGARLLADVTASHHQDFKIKSGRRHDFQPLSLEGTKLDRQLAGDWIPVRRRDYAPPHQPRRYRLAGEPIILTTETQPPASDGSVKLRAGYAVFDPASGNTTVYQNRSRNAPGGYHGDLTAQLRQR
jgi:hypothetical protein